MANAAAAQAPATDAELSLHLSTVRTQVAEGRLDPNRRQELVLEMATTLDRAARAAPDSEVRRRRWAEAIDLLDWFTRENSDLPQVRQMRFQAAVYRWAQAQSWQRAGLSESSETKSREHAVTLLDDAIARLRAVSEIGGGRVLADNLRFRLAQALADRAAFEPAGSPERRSRESEGLELLEKPATEPGLAGYWHLLRADLLRRDGEPAEAGKALEAATKATPPPPVSEIVEVRIPLLIEQHQFAEAIKAVADSHLDPPVQGLWRVRIDLAQLAGLREEADRYRIESDLFQRLRELRAGKSPEARWAFLELVRSGISPAARLQPEAWDLLAEAYQAVGDSARAGAESVHAAERAATLGQAAAAANYRLRGGAFFYQAGKYGEADAVLSQVADVPAAGEALRAQAGMLRALARGRALALHLPGSSVASYADALQQQIRDFPHYPTTDEARWLLGGLARASSQRDQARSLWTTIPPGSPRWLDSRLALAADDRDELERLQINPDRQLLTEQFQQADRFLAANIPTARSETANAELLLAQARLNLTPLVGSSESAKQISEQVDRLPVSPGLHYRTRLYRMIALIQYGRYIEAEREAKTHRDWLVLSERNALFDAIRLLDLSAATATTDLRQRRFGLVLKLIVEPLLDADDKMTPDQRSELGMRMTRALLYIGDDREARRSISAWKGVPQAASDRLLRDIGDTYSRLEMPSFDIDVQRLRMRKNPTGSLAWLDARYSLALAHYRSGQYKEAAQLIDATAILHPDLGGGELHDKFVRLRQKLGTKP
jgi:tetratricopeptide (TPR) repeat protein